MFRWVWSMNAPIVGAMGVMSCHDEGRWPSAGESVKPQQVERPLRPLFLALFIFVLFFRIEGMKMSGVELLFMNSLIGTSMAMSQEREYNLACLKNPQRDQTQYLYERELARHATRHRAQYALSMSLFVRDPQHDAIPELIAAERCKTHEQKETEQNGHGNQLNESKREDRTGDQEVDHQWRYAIFNDRLDDFF